jgi:uncharacterized Zn finger protein (UPF0148 family)
METPTSPSGEKMCPNCGQPMQRWPTLDGADYVDLCPTCSPTTEPIKQEDLHDPPPSMELNHEKDPRVRFRELILTSQKATFPEDLPEEMLESLPEEARETLSQRKRTPRLPRNEQFSETMTEALRDRGYVIDQDAHGVRISGGPSGGLDSETVSPYDVIRMAAELEGGLLPLDERVHCLKCDAVIPPDKSICQWCGEPAPPHKES